MASFTTLPSEIRLQIITWALHASRNDEERAHAGGDIGFAGVADKRTALSLARLDRRTRSELGETLKKYNARVIVQEIDEQLEHLHNAELQIRRVTGQASFAPQEKLCLHCSISRDSPLCMQQYVVHMAAEEVEAAAQALARKLIAMSFIETMTRGEGNHLTTEFLLGAETPPVEVNVSWAIVEAKMVSESELQVKHGEIRQYSPVTPSHRFNYLEMRDTRCIKHQCLFRRY